MFNWLRRLWQSIFPGKQGQDAASMGKDRGAGSSAPEASQVAPEVQPPVIVRGKYWINRGETRWQLPPEPEKPDEGGVEELIKQLGRVDRVEIRRSAAQELAHMDTAAVPAISALLIAAVDVDPALRAAALDALEAIDPHWPQNAAACKAFPNLVSALNSLYTDVNDAAMGLLNRIGPPAVPDLANALLKEADTVKNVNAINILARSGPAAASAVPGLTRALGSQFSPVRTAAAVALEKIGPAAVTALPALVVGLTDRYADGRQATASCLARLGPAAEPAMPALLPLLADRESRVRKAAAAALEQIGLSAIPAVIEIIQARDARQLKALFESRLKDSRWHTRPRLDLMETDDIKALSNLSWATYHISLELESLVAAQEAALRLLGKFGYAASAAVPSVIQALADPSPRIQSAAASILVHIEPDARGLMPTLVQLLINGDESFRFGAAKALGCIDPNWLSDPGLAGAIADIAGQLGSEAGPGQVAVDIFVAIGEAALPLLIDALASGNRVARKNAAKALGQIGPAARAAIPALTRALQDNHPSVRDEAARALALIANPTSFPPSL